MHWQIKLQDENGHFWLTERDSRMWSDSAEDVPTRPMVGCPDVIG
jgi:hypothetical protein